MIKGFDKHGNIFPPAFPPCLPESITLEVVKKYKWLLLKELYSLRGKTHLGASNLS
jgi:hypothetical protein